MALVSEVDGRMSKLRMPNYDSDSSGMDDESSNHLRLSWSCAKLKKIN